MSYIRHYTDNTKSTIKSIILDNETSNEINYLWLCHEPGTSITELTKVDAKTPSQIYITKNIAQNYIIDYIDTLMDYDFFILLKDSPYLIYEDASYSSAEYYIETFDNPTTVFENPISFAELSNYYYVLFPGNSSGSSYASVCKYNSSGTYQSKLDLNRTDHFVYDAVNIIDVGSNLWIIANTSPVKLIRVYTGGTLYSDTNEDISSGYAINNIVKLISYDTNTLFFVTGNNPTTLIKVDITTVTAPVFSAQILTGFSSATSLTANSTTGYVYVACGSGKIAKVKASDMSDYSIIDLSTTNNLTIIGTIPDDYILYVATDASTEDLYIIDEREASIIDTKLNVVAQKQSYIETYLDVIEGKLIDTKLEILAQTNTIINTNLYVLGSSFSSINPLGREDFHVYINNVEVPNNDVDLSSITIRHTIGEESEATFLLARKHDCLDWTLSNSYSQITNQNSIKIYIGSTLEFDGKIGEIDASYGVSEEKVLVTAYATQPTEQYNQVILPLPGLTENRNLYHVILQNPKIYNPYVSATETNPKIYKGIKISLGKRTTENVFRGKYFGNTSTLATNYNSGTFKPKQNYSYFWFVHITKVTISGGTTTTQSNQTATTTGIFSESGSEISEFIKTQTTLFHDLNVSTTSSFSTAGITNYTPSLATIILQYIGTSLGSMSSGSTLYSLDAASYYYQRERESTDYKLGEGTISVTDLEEEFTETIYAGQHTSIFNAIKSNGYINSSGTILTAFKNVQSMDEFDIGYGQTITNRVYDLLEKALCYTVGEAPYKEVSVRNGEYISKWKYSDESDGLYETKNEEYNYTDYAKQIANLEYSKLKTINNVITPITSANLNLTIDGYYYYNIKLLTRLNIDNTTTTGIFYNNNGFPIAVKTITISAGDMQVSLNTDNQKSDKELDAIDATYPDEYDEAYYKEAQSKKLFTKINISTGSIAE